jgi:dihydrofolate reductase
MSQLIEKPMRTVYYTASSLDGFIADEQHGIDWLMQFPDDGSSTYPEFIARIGAVCMGAHTYEWMWRHHIGPDAPEPMAWPYAQPVWVLSSRALPHPPAGDVRFASGDVRAIHAEMTHVAAGKGIWVVGGGDLAGQFYDAGLLDEIIVTMVPVTLGRGMPLLPRRITSPPLVLEAVRQVGPAFAHLQYRVQRLSETATASGHP